MDFLKVDSKSPMFPWNVSLILFFFFKYCSCFPVNCGAKIKCCGWKVLNNLCSSHGQSIWSTQPTDLPVPIRVSLCLLCSLWRPVCAPLKWQGSLHCLRTLLLTPCFELGCCGTGLVLLSLPSFSCNLGHCCHPWGTVQLTSPAWLI